MHYALACMNVVTTVALHVGLKISVHECSYVALCFSMHVGVKISVNVVMLHLHYASACMNVVML